MNTQSVETPTLTPDDHLFLFSTAVDTIQKIVDLPDQQLHALLQADGCDYQRILLASHLFIFSHKISLLLVESDQLTLTPTSFTVTPQELETLYWALVEYHRYTGTDDVYRLQNKVDFLRSRPVSQRDYTVLPADLGRSNSGDACRHSAQSPDAVGQGGNQ